MKIHHTISFALSLITLTFFLSSQILIPNFANAANFAETKIKHSPIEYFIPGKRIKIKTQIKNPKGIKLARCYFKAEGEANFVFVTMDAMGKSKFHGILPAPSNSTKTIEYLFLAVTNENQIVKTQTFKSHFEQQEIPPEWQTVSAKKELTVSTELPKAPSEIKGFSDSIVMDVAESSARFGVVAGGLYTSISAISSSGTATASGTATSAAATAASTGFSAIKVIGTTIAGAAAIAAGAIAISDSGGSDDGYPSSGTESNDDESPSYSGGTANYINRIGTWNYSFSKNTCSNYATGTESYIDNGNGTATYTLNGDLLDANCNLIDISPGLSYSVDANELYAITQNEAQHQLNSMFTQLGLNINFQITEFSNEKIVFKEFSHGLTYISTRI